MEERVQLAGDAAIGAMMRTTIAVDVRSAAGFASAEIPVSSSQYPFYSGSAPIGQLGAVIEGPRTQDARTWWRVDFGPGKYAGWLTEDVLTASALRYTRGIDVSHWQSQINWTSVKNFGIEFAFMKATESTDFIDDQFQRNVTNSRNAGVLVGFYHFANILQTGDIAGDARAEAAHFVSVAGPHIRAPGLPPVLDLEGRGLSGQPPNKAAISAWTRAWLAEVQRLTSVRPMIYANSDWTKNYIESDLKQYDLWHARWTRDLDQPPLPSDPGIWAPNWSFWQYSSNTRVPGIAAGTPGVLTDVDGDVFPGNLAELQAWSRMKVPDTIPPAVSGVSASPTSIPAGQDVTVQWTATDYVAVDKVGLYLYQNGSPVDTRPYVSGGTASGQLAANSANLPNNGSYRWTAPLNLPPGSYQIKVVAWDAAGNNSPNGANLLSNNVSVTLPPLTAVTDLAATAIATNQIRLIWTDSAIAETGFYVDRSTDGTIYTRVAAIGAGGTSYDDLMRESSRRYYYRIQAFRSGGVGPMSNIATAVTPQLTTINGTDGDDSYFVARLLSQLLIYENIPASGPATYSSDVSALGANVTINTLGGDDSIFVDVGGEASLGTTLIYNAGAGDNTLAIIDGGARIDSIAAEGATLETHVAPWAELTTSRLNQNALVLGDASRVTLLPGGGTSKIASLLLGVGATLDLTDNALVLDYTGASPIADVRAKILSARGGSGLGKGWNGAGITSTSVAQANQASPESRSIGYAENALLPLGAYTTFRSQAVDATSILIAYTRTGDANLNGVVNDDDVTVLGTSYAPGVSKPAWAQGDFEYNGFADDDDVTLLGTFYNPAASPPPPAAKDEVLSTKDEGLDVVAWSPDHATGATEGLLLFADTLETSGQVDVRGQETRAQQDETRAQPVESALDDTDVLLDLLAESIASKNASAPVPLASSRLPRHRLHLRC